MKIYQDMSVLVLSHGFRLVSGGPAQDIRDFLKDKVASLDYIDHPFPIADYRQTHFFSYLNGDLKSTKKSFSYLVDIELIRYIQQFFVTFFFLLFSTKKYDVCFALDNHSTIAVSLFRKIGIIKKLVYYSIDYTPTRFHNPFLNNLYHFADRLACSLSDINWVVAKHMIQGRKENGVNIQKKSPFVEVPMGFRKQDIKILSLSKVSFYNLVYMGTILEKQGLQLVVESLPKLLLKFPKLNLTIIGTGDYENQLESQVEELKLTTHVSFKGFAGREKMIDLISQGSIGLAPYKPIPGSFSYYSDPSKIKIYLGCGLPVITTGVTAFSKVIEKTKAGVVINYDTDSFCRAVAKMLENKESYKFYRNNALNLSTNYITEEILRKAIEQI